MLLLDGETAVARQSPSDAQSHFQLDLNGLELEYPDLCMATWHYCGSIGCRPMIHYRRAYLHHLLGPFPTMA